MQTAIVEDARAVIAENCSRKLVVGVTGITGTVGKRLAELLQADGYTVVGLVRGKRAGEQQDGLSYRPVYGTITDWRSVKEFVSGLDVVIHLAAHAGHGDKKLYCAVNVDGVLNLCEAIATTNPSCRLINCSSIAALRVSRLAPFLATVYARSKAKADRIVEDYRVTRGLRAATVYPGLVYGPGDSKFLPKVIENLRKGGFFFVTGGEKNAPIIYIDDLCELFCLAALNPNSSGNHYIGVEGSSMGIHGFFNSVADHIGASTPKRVLKKAFMMPVAMLVEFMYALSRTKNSPPITRRVVDILSINLTAHSGPANRQIGWAPKTSVEDGLEAFFRWWNAQSR